MQDTLPDFTNKIVLVYFDSGAPNNYSAVENGGFEMQGGNLFLVGRGPRSKLGWGPGILEGLAWSKVQSCYVFENVDEFNRLYYGNQKKPAG